MKSTLLNRQLFLTICVVSALSSSALAQKGGGGGGGTEVGTPLSFTSAAVIGGQIPTWSGNYTITPSAPGYYSMKKVGATKADFSLYNTGTQVVRHLDFVVVQDVLGNVLATAKG